MTLFVVRVGKFYFDGQDLSGLSKAETYTHSKDANQTALKLGGKVVPVFVNDSGIRLAQPANPGIARNGGSGRKLARSADAGISNEQNHRKVGFAEKRGSGFRHQLGRFE